MRARSSKKTSVQSPGQRIVVMVGAQKGTEGVTVAKIGDKWQCKLDGLTTYPSSPQSGCIDAPDPQAMLDHLEPRCVDEEVPLQDMLGWVHAYCSNPDKPCRLHRRHPADSLWVSVLLQAAQR